MTAADTLLAQRPALRDDVRVGPPLLRGAARVYLLKDQLTGRCYEVGEKEHFVISRLDGDRCLAQVGDDYAETFGRVLGEASWHQLLALLHRRHLLVGDTPPADEPADDALTPEERTNGAARRRSLLAGRISAGDPGELVFRIHARIGFVCSVYVVAPLALLSVVMLAILVTHLPELARQSLALHAQPELVMLVFVLLWVSLCLHEVAHGLVCTHFGGRASEIGLVWRIPSVFLYCKVDDVLLFPSRWRRVATASAGVFTNLVCLLPFFALWASAIGGRVVRDFAACLLLLGGAGALANLLPFLRLDGYMMLNHALGMSNLSGGSWSYLRLLARRMLRRPVGTVRYPAWAAVAYCAYAFCAVSVSGALVASLALLDQHIITRHLGGWCWLVTVVVTSGCAALAVVRRVARARI